MDLLTKSDVTRIARVDGLGDHVSLFLPTHRAGPGIEQDRIRWKNLLVQADDALRATGLRAPEAAKLLAGAWEVHEDVLFWQTLSEGLAYFVSPTWQQSFRVPIDLPEVGVVGERFVVGPLLPMLSGDSRFLLLSLSQNRVRLLEGSRYRMAEVELRDVPTSLKDVVQPGEGRPAPMARLSSSQGGHAAGRAVFYGHGAPDERFKQDEVELFLRHVSGGLHHYLRNEQAPMVLAGLDYLIPIFRMVNTYPYVLDEALAGNHDQLSASDLHERAWPIVRAALHAEERRAIDRFHELHGTGRALTDLEEILTAAAEGRVDTLFLSEEPGCWESQPNEVKVIHLGAESTRVACESLDRAAVDAVSQRGKVYVVAAVDLPGGGDVAAILRY